MLTTLILDFFQKVKMLTTLIFGLTSIDEDIDFELFRKSKKFYLHL
jgi:hypothetical protein